jgi:hypothetical protein
MTDKHNVNDSKKLQNEDKTIKINNDNNYINIKIKKIFEKNLIQTSTGAKEINSRKIRLLHEIGML